MNDYILQLIIQAKDEFSAELKKVEQELGDVKKTAEKTGNSANNVLSSIKSGIAKLGLGALVVKTTKDIIGLADNLEKAQIAFETMLGSGENARIMLEQLSDFAKKTPFELTGIRQNAQQLIAMGVNANDIIPTLKSLGDVSAGLSVPLERLALNYGQVIAQGKLTGRELRDFTMAGVPLLDELANQLGTTKTAIQDMISKGQISSNDVIQAFKNMTSEGGRFANLMNKQATTLSGMRSNLKDELNSLGEQIGQSFLPIIKGYIDQILKRINENVESIKVLAIQLFQIVSTVASNIIGLVKNVGEFCMSLFFGIKQDGSNSAITFGQIFMSVLQKIGQGIEAASKMVSQLRTVMKTGTGNVKNWLGGIGQGFKEAMAPGVKLKDAWGEFMHGFGTYKADEIVEVKDLISGITNDRVDFGAEVIKQEDQLFTSFAKTESYFNNIKEASKNLDLPGALNLSTSDMVEGLGGGTSSSGGGKSAIKETTDDLKDLIDEMNDYAKETMDMKEATYEGIVKSMEDAVKSAEKLSDEVADLQDKLQELNQSETTDIAEQYVNVEEKLKDLREEYANIEEAVNSLGEAYIKNQMGRKEDFEGIDRNTLREYINLQEQLASAYQGLDEAGVQALNEQIEKQREYNSLNDIEKIKADYAEKKAQIEQEIADKQQQIQAEIDEYNRLRDEKIKYENEWLNYMTYSYQQQHKMNADLISQLQRIIALKQQAGMSVDGRRAGGGTVYGGKTYLVGEYGPELFTPNQRGSITPNNQITNNNGIEVNISGVSVRNDNDIQEIAQEIVRQIKLEKDFGIA